MFQDVFVKHADEAVVIIETLLTRIRIRPWSILQLQLHSMLLDGGASANSKEHALHAVGNMVRSSAFCLVFNRMDG
jgi:hypothetical protein